MAALALVATPALGGGALEAAAALYRDERLSSAVGSVAATAESETTAVRLGSTVKDILFKEKEDLLEQQLDGQDRIRETSLQAAVDQQLAVGSQVGLFGGGTRSPLTRSHHLGLRGGQWWRSETLQTTLEVRRTVVTQPPIEFTDTDGKRIETPADLEGVNAALTATHFTTPTTILRGTVSRTERSDRPPATAVSGELRQFVTPAGGALHLALTHYENVGRIEPTQSYGSLVADSGKVEWHQRLGGAFILMGGYRSYLEHEKPRAADARRRQLGTDDLYTSLRWRFGSGAWTDDASEAYLVAARYETSKPNAGALLGLGVRWLY